MLKPATNLFPSTSMPLHILASYFPKIYFNGILFYLLSFSRFILPTTIPQAFLISCYMDYPNNNRSVALSTGFLIHPFLEHCFQTPALLHFTFRIRDNIPQQIKQMLYTSLMHATQELSKCDPCNYTSLTWWKRL